MHHACTMRATGMRQPPRRLRLHVCTPPPTEHPPEVCVGDACPPHAHTRVFGCSFVPALACMQALGQACQHPPACRRSVLRTTRAHTWWCNTPTCLQEVCNAAARRAGEAQPLKKGQHSLHGAVVAHLRSGGQRQQGGGRQAGEGRCCQQPGRWEMQRTGGGARQTPTGGVGGGHQQGGFTH